MCGTLSTLPWRTLPWLMRRAENVGNPVNFNPQGLQLVTHFLSKRPRNELLKENTIHEIYFYDHSPQYLAGNNNFLELLLTYFNIT